MLEENESWFAKKIDIYEIKMDNDEGHFDFYESENKIIDIHYKELFEKVINGESDNNTNIPSEQ